MNISVFPPDYKGRCGCNQAKLPCTMFCMCQGGAAGCFNPQTKLAIKIAPGDDEKRHVNLCVITLNLRCI